MKLMFTIYWSSVAIGLVIGVFVGIALAWSRGYDKGYESGVNAQKIEEALHRPIKQEGR